ncbi:MAG: hypothetical protein KGL43_24815 [Burkholderiales bacterium]|nr:hypothetical protein [Burkholderiales bacterium]MDE2395456.1 hypothetical protein [Burkholderiales bacterium]MDE2456824.1 hypothetical protein [Burkholderiales bacterium]
MADTTTPAAVTEATREACVEVLHDVLALVNAVYARAREARAEDASAAMVQRLARMAGDKVFSAIDNLGGADHG